MDAGSHTPASVSSRFRRIRNAGAVKIRYLNDDETRRLVNACPPDLRAIVVTALLTGARYGEIAALRVSAPIHPVLRRVWRNSWRKWRNNSLVSPICLRQARPTR
jgi:integrase